VQSLEISPGRASLVYRRMELPPGLLARFIWGPGSNEEMRRAVRAHVERLLEAAPSLPRGEPRLGAAVEVAFARARARSATSPPVLENRAALLALGLLLGHRRLEDFVGPVLDERAWRRAAPLARTTLRGRDDWTKHFFVSAALTVLSAQTPSEAIGIVKEELDAGGGSGFSFGDLLADRAGTTFALLATRAAASTIFARRPPISSRTSRPPSSRRATAAWGAACSASTPRRSNGASGVARPTGPWRPPPRATRPRDAPSDAPLVLDTVARAGAGSPWLELAVSANSASLM
jgi:hypothetical protein